MSSGKKVKAAIIGSGNIGMDLLMKILRAKGELEVAALVGIDPESDGLKRARRLGIPTTDRGIDGLIEMAEFGEIGIVFDATSAAAHARHNEILARAGKKVIDLTPAAVGPFVVPPVNLDEHLAAQNLNMVTCGGQATIPIVAAVSSVVPVIYAEIVASIASKSAGPGTRANIDEFTETTSDAIVRIGGAKKGKAIIVLNPAEPPLLMRDTVYCLSEPVDKAKVEASIEAMVRKVAHYVPGYRLKHKVQFEEVSDLRPVNIPGLGRASGLKTTVFLEVEGAAHYLPSYAGNLDIMTSAALATGVRLAQQG